MKQMIFSIRILCISLGFCLLSCNEDKGNYSYETINKVTGFQNISDAYTVELGEELIINPTLETSLGKEDDFEFNWYYATGTSAWKVLQEGRTLDFIIASPIGMPNTTYTCAFEAKNKITDVAYRKTFTVKVAGTFNKGYVFVYEKENDFDMGMVVLNSQNQYLLKHDILSTTAPDLQREGVKPYGINIFADETAPSPYKTDGSNRSVYLLTDHYTTRLKVSDFTWNSSYDISNAVENGSTLDVNYIKEGKPIIAEKMKTGFFSINGNPKPHIYIYLKDENGKGCWYLHNNYPVWYFFSYPMNGYRSDKGENLYEPAPYLSCGSRGTMFFNEDKNRFCYQRLPRTASDMGTSFFYTEDFNDESTDHVFNFNADNAGLLYMGERYTSLSNVTAFAILKEEDGSFNYIEYYFQTTLTGLTTKTNKLRACKFDAATGIGNAKFIAAAPEPNNAFLYFATQDNRVFYADISGQNAVVEEITDKVTADGYTEITALKFNIPSTTNKYLAIATYNSSLGKDTGGKIDFYSMPNSSSGELSVVNHKVNDNETIEMSWKGLGKIVDIDYKP